MERKPTIYCHYLSLPPRTSYNKICFIDAPPQRRFLMHRENEEPENGYLKIFFNQPNS
jgi:hypothetical protein